MTHRGIPSRFGSDTVPTEALFSRIRASVEATPASTTNTRLRIALVLAVVPWLTAAVVLIGSTIMNRAPASGLAGGAGSPFRLAVLLFLVAGLTAATTIVAVRRGPHGLGARLLSLVTVTVLAPPIYAVLTFASPLRTDVQPALVSPLGLRCLSVAAIVGTLVLAGFAVALRRAAPVATRFRGAALGAAAGAWAGLAMFLYCPGGTLVHLLVGHMPSVVGFTLLGAWVLPRALRP